MANLTSAVPAAFANFLAMVKAAVAAGADTTITVVDTELYSWEPAEYIEVQSVTQHLYEVNNLGNYSFIETFDIQGVCRNFRGDQNVDDARNDVWALFQTYIITPLISNKRLYDQTNNNPTVMWCVPATANFSSGPTSNGGIQGKIDFAFRCYNQITV